MASYAKVEDGVVKAFHTGRAAPIPPQGASFVYVELTEQQASTALRLGLRHPDGGGWRWSYDGTSFAAIPDSRPTVRLSQTGQQERLVAAGQVLPVTLTVISGNVPDGDYRLPRSDGSRARVTVAGGAATVNIALDRPRRVEIRSNDKFLVETPLELEILTDAEL